MPKIKISFPNMGNAWVAFKALLEAVPDVEIVLPPPVNRKTIEYGAKHSPEFVCFPFKVTIGDFIVTYEKYGVTTFATALDCGPCRLGFYHAVQERILEDLGYNFKIIALDQSDLLDFKWIKTFESLFELTGLKDPFKKAAVITEGALGFLRKSKTIADMEKLEAYYRCRELKKGATSKVMKRLLNELDAAKTQSQVQSFRKKMVKDFAAIEHDAEKEPLKVILTGEIHIVLEPYVNLDIRKKLGELGIEVHQELSLMDWVLHKFHLNFHRRELARLSEPYLNLDIGGEAQWVIGEYIEGLSRGMDGLVHIYPFTCMPEVTARSILSAMDEPKMPCLYFAFDENSGVEGMKTRIEAFVDLMEDRKRKGMKAPADPKYDMNKSMIEDIVKSVNNPMEDILSNFGGMLNILKDINPFTLIGDIFNFTKKEAQS